ncbi:MAG: hypothetical protein J6Y93_02985 [Treponema sp.]|nr:hypothetical protein [Treponema sp.]
MGRNNNFRRGRNRGGNGEQNRQRSSEHRRPQFNSQQQKEIEERENAIKEFKSQTHVCEICGEPITEISSAINNRGSGNPVHFDCVLAKLNESEKPGPNERVTYIGNGRFAVLHFENIHDIKHFTIQKTIEWEARDDERGDWRDEMAGLYSRVK